MSDGRAEPEAGVRVVLPGENLPRWAWIMSNVPILAGLFCSLGPEDRTKLGMSCEGKGSAR
jgi:hypothetical protein